MTLDEIVYSFTYPKQYQYPTGAVNEAIAKQVEITPILLEYIKISPSELEKIYQLQSEDSENFMWFFSVFLLGQFKEKKALPYIIEFLTNENQALVHSLMNDFLTEHLPEILAAIFDDDIEVFFNIINNKNYNESIRNAFLKATTILVMYGILDKDEMRPRYLALLTEEQIEENNDNDFIEYSLLDLADLADPFLRVAIDNALVISNIESSFFSKADIQETYNDPPKKGDRFNSLDIDTNESLQSWGWFDNRHNQEINDDNYFNETYKRKTKKVGRNESCPCGSGKKYKKCCLN